MGNIFMTYSEEKHQIDGDDNPAETTNYYLRLPGL